MKKSIIALTMAGLIGLTACGKETVYIVTDATEAPADEAPDTTVKRTTTTQPAETRPPASVPSSSSVYDPEEYDTFIWSSVKDFWWLFTKEDLLTMGLLVCEEFDRGSTLDEVTQQLINAMTNTNTAYLMEGLAAVTAGALTYLCPEHSWWLETIA
jgi:hypothetical protein